MSWFYMSFADDTRPRGDRWLGCLFVEGADLREALERSWRLAINPGGEMTFAKVTDDMIIPPAYRERLLGKIELLRLDRMIGGDGALVDFKKSLP